MLVNQGEGTVRKDVELPEDSNFSLIAPDDLEKLRFFDVSKIIENREDWIARWQEEVIAE